MDITKIEKGHKAELRCLYALKDTVARIGDILCANKGKMFTRRIFKDIPTPGNNTNWYQFPEQRRTFFRIIEHGGIRIIATPETKHYHHEGYVDTARNNATEIGEVRDKDGRRIRADIDRVVLGVLSGLDKEIAYYEGELADGSAVLKSYDEENRRFEELVREYQKKVPYRYRSVKFMC